MSIALSPVRAELSFAAPFLHEHLGIRYTQSFLADPELCIRATRDEQGLVRQKKTAVTGQLPPVGQPAGAGLEPVVTGYVTTTMPMMLGCSVDFQDSEYPHAKPLDMSDEAVMAMTPIVDFSTNPVMCDLEAQAAWLKRKYGRSCIRINMQSVVNIAFKLRGDQLMFDFFEKPHLAHKLIHTIQETWINAREWIARVNRENGMPTDNALVTIDNCNAAMLSPDIYREFFFSADRNTVRHYAARSGIHHCGANMEKFAVDYAALGQGIWYDIGYGSDVAACVTLFKAEGLKQDFSVRFGPARLLAAEPDDIHAELNRLAAAGASYILCIGADPCTPDLNLKTFWNWEWLP